MTKEEMILFGKANGLLRKAKFHYNAQKDERDLVVEKIQELLCTYGLNMLANMQENNEKES
jgi:hypothetical protein